MSKYHAYLASPVTVPNGNSNLLVNISGVPSGTYKFSWVAFFNSLNGNGNNGQLSIGFGDNFVGSTGGPAATVLSGGACQFATLSPDGSALNGISNPLFSGVPEIITQANVTVPLYTQGSLQTGNIVLPSTADVALYFASSAFDGTDNQVITDAILILESVPAA